jgi:hypothetical protein
MSDSTQPSRYAVVATVVVEDVASARAALQSQRVGFVDRAPGFICAYWLAPVDSIGMSVLVFDTQEHAEQAAQYPLSPLPGIKPRSLEVREVVAHTGSP